MHPLIATCLMVAAAPSASAFSASPVLGIKATNLQQQQQQHRSSKLDAFRFGSAEAEETVASSSSLSVLEETVLDPLRDVLVATLRVGTCALMIHHGIDKIDNVEGFSANVVAKFFGFLPGDPSFWTLSAAFTQVGGSVLLGLGVLARPVALSMCTTMAVAVVFHLLNTGGEGFPLAVVPQHSYNYELAAMYVGVLAYFSVAGAGAYSVDEQILGGELNLYGSVLDSVLPGGDNEKTNNSGSGSSKRATSTDGTGTYMKNTKEFKMPWSK